MGAHDRGRRRHARLRLLLDILQRHLHVVDVLVPPLRILAETPENHFLEVALDLRDDGAGAGCARITALSVSAVDAPGNARDPVTIS